MVDKLILGKIIRIIFTSLLVALSIPVWDSFDKKISAANVITLEDYYLSKDLEKEQVYKGKNYTEFISVQKKTKQLNIYNGDDFYKLNNKSYT